MPSTSIRYSVNQDIVDKASPEEMAVLNHAMIPTTGTAEDLYHHLNGGGAFCNAFLRSEPDGYASRKRDSFVEAWIIAADIDNSTIDANGHKRRKTAEEGYYPLGDALRDEAVTGQASFLYTTPSHTPEWNRFRIVWVLPEPITDPEHYRTLVRAFIERYDSDPSCSSPTQIFFGSSKGDFHWFGNTLNAYTLRSVEERTQEMHEHTRKLAIQTNRDLTEQDVREMLATIPPQLDYIDWVKIISSVTTIVGEHAAERLVEEWSPGHNGEVKYKIARRLERIGPGTLIYYARKNGWTPPAGLYSDDKPKNNPETVRRYLANFYDWRKNDVTNHVECRPTGSAEWIQLTDYDLNSILGDMRMGGLAVSKERLVETVDSAFSPVYHPFRDYFADLEPWDGEDRFADLVSILPPDPNLYGPDVDFHEYARMILSRWFRGAYVAATQGKANHLMPILQGGQGIGKTRFLLSLCPPALADKYQYVGPISDDKDTRTLMARAFIGIDDELESMSRREINAVKSLLTQDVITVRLPYARFESKLKRTVSFIGSVNRRNFLNDETGSRRFPVLALGGEIDMEARAGISTEQLWAQAKFDVDRGEKHWVDGSEIERILSMNEEFTLTNDADDLLQKYFEPCEVDDPKNRRLSTTEVGHQIARYVMVDTGNDVKMSVGDRFVFQLGRSLRRHRYTEGKTNGRKVWNIKPRIPTV